MHLRHTHLGEEPLELGLERLGVELGRRGHEADVPKEAVLVDGAVSEKSAKKKKGRGTPEREQHDTPKKEKTVRS